MQYLRHLGLCWMLQIHRYLHFTSQCLELELLMIPKLWHLFVIPYAPGRRMLLICIAPRKLRELRFEFIDFVKAGSHNHNMYKIACLLYCWDLLTTFREHVYKYIFKPTQGYLETAAIICLSYEVMRGESTEPSTIPKRIIILTQ